MKIAISKRETKETLVYLALWLLLFIAPVITYLIRVMSHGASFRWSEVLEVWSVLLVYLIVFVIHNFLLAPLLIYRKKKLLYFFWVFCVLVVFTFYQCTTRKQHHWGGPPQHEMMGPGNHEGAMRPNGFDGGPMVRAEDRPPLIEEVSLEDDSIGHPMDAPADDRMAGGLPPVKIDEMPDSVREKEFGPWQGFRGGEPLMMTLNNAIGLIIVLLTIGMNLGVKLYFKSDEDAKELRELEKKSLEQQLAYLKYQINPHFFMNTLNNIHALVDIDPEKAKDTILELSKMMRYVLYEGDKQVIPLQRETDFLKTYISLMRLRYTDKVKISVDIPKRMPEAGIPPLLLITFVENAFKHGISYKQDCFIKIKMSLDDDRLKFTCKNSKVLAKEGDSEKAGGVGLANVKQRLELLYGNNYTLDFDEAEDTYEVLLLLPLNKKQLS